MKNNDAQLIKDVDLKINKCKADIVDLKEKSKNLEIEISVNENNIEKAKEDLINLDPDVSAIINDPEKLQKYADNLRSQLVEWTSSQNDDTVELIEETQLVE